MALVCLVSVASAHPNTSASGDVTPATCDQQKLVHHLHRARALIQTAYARQRWQDATPAKDAEKRAWQAHRRCIEVRKTRAAISDYRDKQAAKFGEYRAEQLALSRIDPPGASYLAGLRACESGGNYATNTGNGFYGAYQFDLGTWRSVGGSGYPHLASPAEQDYRAAVLWRSRGSAPWPVCG